MKFADIDFTELMPNGKKRFKLLASGGVYDNSVGRIAAREQSSAQGSELGQKRKREFREASQAAILKEAQSIDPNVKTPAEAFGMLMAKQYQTFMDAEKPRGDDLLKFSQLLGGTPSAAEEKAALEVPKINMHSVDQQGRDLTSALLEFMIEQGIRGRYQVSPEPIEAEFEENTEDAKLLP
jgi:hypothetical protein